MIRNVMETNASEAFDLINFKFILLVLILTLVPTWLMSKINLADRGWLNNLWSQFKAASCAVSLIVVLLYTSYPSYASIARTHRHLSHLILPTNFIFAGLSYAKESLASKKAPFKDLTNDVARSVQTQADSRQVTVLIIGETARADHFAINGYEQNTTPKLKERSQHKNSEIINFKQASSCGTSTAVSLPCMFSYLTRKEYNHKKGKNSSNMLDFIQQSGIDVQWRDNNTGCKGLCDRIDYVDLTQETDPKLCGSGECHDEILLKGLNEHIRASNKDQLIVLHQKGSHGPAYHLRYPKEFEVFKPTCQTVNLQKCSKESLNNSYDNSILYTDYVIDKTIAILEAMPNDTQVSLIYISDHGESLGENNLYLHGTPYVIAPEVQTHVPFLFWQPTDQLPQASVDMSCMNNKSTHPVSHDQLFHSVLGLLNVETSLYQENNDLFSSCQSRSQVMLASSAKENK